MGITMWAKNSSIELDMGYGAFHNLRRNIAAVLDPAIGDLYHQLASVMTDDVIEAERQLYKILSDDEKFPDEKVGGVIDFLFLPDVEATLGHKACKQVYDLIKDVDFEDKGFQYVSHRTSGKNDYELLKELLKECYQHRRKLRWS